MKKHLPFLSLLVFVLLITSCAQKIVSNKAEGYTKKPKVIFIEGVYQAKGADVSNGFAKELSEQLLPYGIQSMSYTHNNLSFDTDEDIYKKADSYKAEAIMVIKQVYSANNSGDGSFNIALYDAQTKNPFWKSTFDIGMGDIYNDQSAITTAKAIIKKLIEDGVIAGPAK